ncbi:oligoendopeptidase F [Bacillus timonensis]|nr:oligoendopeptidase F [Bacillus timonensis]
MEKILHKRLKRNEVPLEQTWNLEDLFLTIEAWEKELDSIIADLPSFEVYKGALSSNSQTLLNCLNQRDQLNKKVIKVVTYASLLLSGDGTDPINQANYSRVSAMISTVSASLSFIESEILEIPEELLTTFLNENDELKIYKRNLTLLHSKKQYTLSPETEEALAALGEVHSSPYMIYSRSKSSDMQFPSFIDSKGEEHSLSFALYEDKYEFSPDTSLRRKAYESFNNTLEQYKNTFAATYSTEVKKQVTLSKLRGYESVTDMLLHSQEVTKEMYNNQLDIIYTELAPHMQRFARLKKRVLGLDEMKFCDLKAPLDPDFNPKTTYEDASKVILESLKVMGPEYNEIMEKALTDRWVDLADNVGKSTGAFCSSPYGAHPYILITWTDTMRGAFVLTHELGHAGHFYLANKYQNISNTRPSTYFVEAPSTMNELILGQHLLSQTDDKRMKRWIVLQFLGTYYHNFVTHLLEGEYQRRVYSLAEQGKPLTASTLCQIKGEVLSTFWGDSVTVDEQASLTWMRQPHYYMGLYPYTYSAGLTASTAVSQMIKEEGQPVIDRWLEVLKAGGTMSPLELLKHAGVDMSSPDPIRKAVAFVGSLIDELENSYKD